MNRRLLLDKLNDVKKPYQAYLRTARTLPQILKSIVKYQNK
jgi:hypothetical protein